MTGVSAARGDDGRLEAATVLLLFLELGEVEITFPVTLVAKAGVEVAELSRDDESGVFNKTVLILDRKFPKIGDENVKTLGQGRTLLIEASFFVPTR